MTSSSIRVLVASSVGVLIWVIWLTGMLGDSRRVTMLALSAVSVLGSGLVIELRGRCRAEEAARESERRYRFLADHSFDMIARFDPRSQTHTYVSPACRRLYGYEPQEAVALTLDEIVHPDDLALVHEALARLERQADHPPIVYRGWRKDGSFIPVEASLTRSVHPDSGAAEIVSVVREIGDRIRYEAALRQAKEAADLANHSKSQFLATMSHELRTPLNAILGFAEIMKNEVMGPIGNEQYRSYITDIHLSGTHLLQLINDILDLTKAEAGKLELHEEVIDPSNLIRSVVRVSKVSIEQAGLTVEINLPASLPLVCADERKTRQVLFNLIGNAVKFTPRDGRIGIIADFDPEKGISMSVVDNGIGISPEDLQRIFEPFVQLDSALSRQHRGTGLGLPTAKALVELHGGALRLTSTVGVGTTATVIFPPARAVVGSTDPAARPAA